MTEIKDPYERGFIDGMQEQMKRSVDRAVNAMVKPWVGLNWDDLPEIYVGDTAFMHGAKWAEAKLKEKNCA